MFKKADIDQLQEQIDVLKNKIKMYDGYFAQIAQGFKTLTRFTNTPNVEVNVSQSILQVTPRPVPIKDPIVERVEEDINKAGGFKETVEGNDTMGKYDDPIVMRDPPKWSKDSFVGKKYSQCTPVFLKDLAGFLDWAALDDKKKNTLTSNGKPRYIYRERDAKHARYWAEKLKNNNSSANLDDKLVTDTKYTFEDV